ncbi:MAG TPA: DMT family transporter [Terriglobales bacterium]|nr:DMT family transporter [Terriglobales bacterium]
MPASKGLTALVVASFSFGSAAIFVRLATEVSVLSLTFFRLFIAGCVLLIVALATSQLRRLNGRELVLLAISGVFLSLHFVAYIFAVKGTTIANATFLVNTSPVMLAVLSPVLIRERTTRREILAVILAMLGVSLVANAGNGFRQIDLGELSALLSAFFLTFYTLAGRFSRTGGINTACYTTYVYWVAALVALLLVALLGVRPVQAYNGENLFAIFGLALIPTAFGHSLYNYSLGSVKAVTANLFPLTEPIIASILAVPLFGEVPTPIQITGYAMILIAVVIIATGLK